MPKEIKENWKHLSNIFKDLVKSSRGPAAIRYGILLILLVVLFNIFNVISSFIGRDFISSIEQKNFGNFYSFAILYGLVFLISGGIGSIYRYCEERLGILWREQLTWRLTETYLTERTYHKILNQIGIENPDQRITEDVRAFTTTTLSFTLLLIGGIFSALSFSGVLWSIDPWLFLFAILYASIGTMTAIYLGRSMIRINYDQLDMEATYRADLLHIRQHAESIAVTHREPRLSFRLKTKLKKIVFNFNKLISVNFRLSLFTNSYNYFIQIIPMLFIAPRYIRGEIEFGVITQAALAFTTLLNSFSLIVTQFQSISAFTAVVKRLVSLDTAMNNTENISQVGKLQPNSEISFKEFSLFSNDNTEVLIKNLNLNIKRNETWIVSAPQDNLKLEFFRALVGINKNTKGTIHKPNRDNLLFIPEIPYLPPGRLKNIIVPSYLSNKINDKQILDELKNHGLEKLARKKSSLYSLKEWNDELSLSEKFKISLLRIQFVKPHFLVLDRPGSSLNTFEIQNMMNEFKKLGVSIILIAKDVEKNINYDGHLEILKNGKWRLHQKRQHKTKK